jgi:hypothetical protein
LTEPGDPRTKYVYMKSYDNSIFTTDIGHKWVYETNMWDHSTKAITSSKSGKVMEIPMGVDVDPAGNILIANSQMDVVRNCNILILVKVVKLILFGFVFKKKFKKSFFYTNSNHIRFSRSPNVRASISALYSSVE